MRERLRAFWFGMMPGSRRAQAPILPNHQTARRRPDSSETMDRSPASGPLTLSSAAWFVPAGLVVSALFVWQVYRRSGRLAVPLDDTYIYFQFAQNLAAGRFFEFTVGEGYVPGSTSILYPFLLVPGFWLGLEGRSILVMSYLLSGTFLLLCLWLASRIGRHLEGAPGAFAAPLFLLASGPWLWGIFSGLEGGLFTLVALLGAELLSREQAGSAPSEDHAPQETLPTPVVPLGWVWLLVTLCSLARPEGVPVALWLMICAAWHPARRRRLSTWLTAPLPWIPFVAVSLLNLATTGHTVPNTAVHKSVLYAPDHSMLTVLEHAGHLVIRMVRLAAYGGRLPYHPLGLLGLLIAVAWWIHRWRSRRIASGWATAVYLLGVVGAAGAAALMAPGPGQLGRYFHLPLILTSLATGLGCAAAWRWLVGRMAHPALPRLARLTLVCLVGFFCLQLWRWSGLFGQAAHEIEQQQVVMADWIKSHLPDSATLLLNDVGAMTYLTGRRTFDVCGLTRNGIAPSFREGPGALLEYFEHLSPEERPSHLVIYPHWIQLEQIHGKELHRIKFDQKRVVLGGDTVVAAEADWSLLGTGDAPAPSATGTVVDHIDVADLRSEQAHGYEFASNKRPLPGHKSTLAGTWTLPGGQTLADGGRKKLTEEQFQVSVRALSRPVLRSRLEATKALSLHISVDGGASRTQRLLPAKGFQEIELELPELADRPGTYRIALKSEGAVPFQSFHHWVLEKAEREDRSRRSENE